MNFCFKSFSKSYMESGNLINKIGSASCARGVLSYKYRHGRCAVLVKHSYRIVEKIHKAEKG